MLKKMLNMITDALNKNPNSNIGKIFQVFAQEYNDVNNTLLTMREWSDLENAEGKYLDDIGEDINQKRGNANDTKFRLLIRAKRARSLTDGTINQIIKALATTLNIESKEIKVHQSFDIEPASLMIEAIPTEKIINAGLPYKEYRNILESLVGAGINIYTLLIVSEALMVLEIRSYSYPVYYPETGEFSGEKAFSQLDTGTIDQKEDSYSYEVEYPVSEKKVSIIESEHASIVDDAYNYPKYFQETGEMLTLAKSVSIQESAVACHVDNYGYRVTSPICGEFEAGGEW